MWGVQQQSEQRHTDSSRQVFGSEGTLDWGLDTEQSQTPDNVTEKNRQRPHPEIDTETGRPLLVTMLRPVSQNSLGLGRLRAGAGPGLYEHVTSAPSAI